MVNLLLIHYLRKFSVTKWIKACVSTILHVEVDVFIRYALASLTSAMAMVGCVCHFSGDVWKYDKATA